MYANVWKKTLCLNLTFKHVIFSRWLETRCGPVSPLVSFTEPKQTAKQDTPLMFAAFVRDAPTSEISDSYSQLFVPHLQDQTRKQRLGSQLFPCNFRFRVLSVNYLYITAHVTKLPDLYTKHWF